MKKCYALILQQKDIAGFEIQHTDNNKKHIILVLLDNNYGYGKGNNYGLKLAYRLGYRYSLISNNDVKIADKNVLTELIKEMESDENYVWTSPLVVNSFTGKEELPRYEFNFIDYYFFHNGIFYPFYFMTNRKKVKQKEKNWTQLKKFYNSKWLNPISLHGCFSLFKNNDFNEIGFFDENVFLYFEELIIGEKFAKNSKIFKFVPSVKILHAHNDNEKANVRTKLKRFYHGIKSANYFFKNYKNINRPQLFIANISLIFFYIIYKPIIFVAKKSYRKNISAII